MGAEEDGGFDRSLAAVGAGAEQEFLRAEGEEEAVADFGRSLA